MYEAILYDSRDATSEHPSSTLGEFDSQIDALRALANHLVRFPEQQVYITKLEVVEVA